MRSSQKTWGIWFRAWRSCCWAVEKQLASWWSQSLPPNFKKRQPSNPSNLFFLSIVQLGVSKIDLQGSQKSETLFAACKVWPSGCSGHWPEITLPTKSKELREKTGACLDSYCSIVRWLCIVRFCLLKLKWEIPVFFPPSINAVASRAQIASCWGAGLRGQGAICTSHLQIRPIQKTNPIYTKMSNTVLKTLSNTKFNGKFRLLLRIALLTLLAIKPSISTS